MIDTNKYEGHDNWEGTKVNMANEANKLLIADAPLLLAEVKRFRQMCLSERLCYDCLSDVYVAGLSDENPVDAYWCGYCDEPMKGLIE